MEEKIKAIIKAMDDGEKIALWNESCYECSYYDDAIYSMGEFDEIMDGYSLSDIASRIFYGGGFDPNHDYFAFDGYANLVSFDYPDAEESPFCLNDLVDRIVRNGNAFGNNEIAAVLNGENDETEA